jgi:hypothetical protein
MARQQSKRGAHGGEREWHARQRTSAEAAMGSSIGCSGSGGMSG